MRVKENIPGVTETLEQCKERIEGIIGQKVNVYYEMDYGFLKSTEMALIVCEVCNVSWEQLASKSRRRQIVMARHFYCYFSYTTQSRTLQSIANTLGIDHSTVIHARKSIEDMIDSNDSLYMPHYLDIKRMIHDKMPNRK